jgi:hypothetical protein
VKPYNLDSQNSKLISLHYLLLRSVLSLLLIQCQKNVFLSYRKPSHVAYSLSTPEQPSSASLRFSVKVYRDAPSATRSNLLKPPAPSANMLAASPTSPFASELSSPRVSLPAPMGGAAAAAAQLLAEGGDGAVALMRYGRTALGRRRMSDSRQLLQVHVPRMSDTNGFSSHSSPGPQASRRESANVVPAAAGSSRQISPGKVNGRAAKNAVGPAGRAHQQGQARRVSPRYRRGSAAAVLANGAAREGVDIPVAGSHGQRRLSASPRERKRNAAVAAAGAFSSSPPAASAAAAAGVAPLLSARLSPDAEYYRIWTDHPPGSVPSRSRKVDASTLTETSPIRRLAEGLSSSSLIDGQRSFSGPALISSSSPQTSPGLPSNEEEAELSREADGTLSIAVPNLSASQNMTSATSSVAPPASSDQDGGAIAAANATSSNDHGPRSSRSSQSSGGWPPRRPRSLLHHQQEAEVDLMTTAPLATPEQDSSLLDAISVDGAAASHQLEEEEAMEDEVFEDPDEGSSDSSSNNSRRESGSRDAGFPSGEAITFVFESPSDSSVVDPAPAGAARMHQSSSTVEEINSNHEEEEPMEVGVDEVFDNNNDVVESMDMSAAAGGGSQLGARRKIRPAQHQQQLPQGHSSTGLAGLAPPNVDSDGMTPSPMSVSEAPSAATFGGEDDGINEDNEVHFSSSPNSPLASPSAGVHGDGQGRHSRGRRGRGGFDRLQLPDVDPIDPSVLGAVGFSVEITPPPGI